MEFVQSSRKSNTTTAEMLERVQAESHVPDYWGWGRREQEPFDSLCECTVWYICMRGVAEHGRFFSGYYISKDKNWTRVLARRWRRCVSVYFFVIYNSENTSFPLRKRSSERSLYIARSSRYFVPCDYSFLTFLPEIYYYIFYIYMYLVFRDKYDIVISLERCLDYSHIKPSDSSFANRNSRSLLPRLILSFKLYRK